MEFTTLGKTALKVSVAGLGGGGHSRLGTAYGRSSNEAASIVRAALDQGINFIDTAENYQTEPIVKIGIESRLREQLVISTKKAPTDNGKPIKPALLKKGVENSLKRLGTDYIDVFHLHGLKRTDYDHAVRNLLPTLLQLKEQGKLRCIGVTEAFFADPSHEMLTRAMEDDCWDVIMVGFNMLNQSARKLILPRARAKGIGVLIMFAVRRALSHPQRLTEVIRELINQGRIPTDRVDVNDPLGFVLQQSDARTLPEAAYRFCRHEPGTDVILTGTGNQEHLAQNVRSILQPPLPGALHQQIVDLFARVDNVSGN